MRLGFSLIASYLSPCTNGVDGLLVVVRAFAFALAPIHTHTNKRQSNACNFFFIYLHATVTSSIKVQRYNTAPPRGNVAEPTSILTMSLTCKNLTPKFNNSLGLHRRHTHAAAVMRPLRKKKIKIKINARLPVINSGKRCKVHDKYCKIMARRRNTHT